MELKSNERLSIQGLIKVENFYSKLSSIWDICDLTSKIKLGNCFRCIANGGIDPNILRCDIKTWVPDGYKQKVTDKQFIQKVFRETVTLEVIVYEFLLSAKTLNYDEVLTSKKNETVNEASIETKQSSENEDGKESDNPSIPLNETSKASKASITRDYTQVMLDLCLELSLDSKSAFQMCLHQVCDGAIVLLEKDFAFNPTDTRISYIVELMWNAVEYYLAEAKAEDYLSSEAEDIMDFERAIHVLQVLLNFNLLNGFRLSDKELRNEILVILAMLAQFPKSVSNFMESGLFNLLVTYACIEEVGRGTWFFFNKPVANSRNFSTISDIDLEFKKEVWFTISELLRTNDPDALLCFASSPLLSCMLMYLEQNSIEKSSDDIRKSSSDAEINKSASIFDPAMKDRINPHIILKKPVEFIASLPLYKLREFQLLAATFIVQNASKIICEFERQDGIGRLISLIMNYSKSDMIEHKNIIFNALILINKCLSNSLSIRAYLEDTNSIETFLYVFQKDESEDTRAQSLRIISALCSNSNLKCQQQLTAINGIYEIIKPIEKYVQNRRPIVGLKAGIKLITQNGLFSDDLQDPLENPYGGEVSVLIIGTLDCISKSVVGNKNIESVFAENEGVDALLDLLEISTFVLRIQVLRVLADILLNPMLVSYVNAWRSGKTLRSAAQVLCHCWLDEEMRLNSARGENGVICDIWNPLGNQQWPKEDHEMTMDDKTALLMRENSSKSLIESQVNDNKSFTVTKLATAILTSRNIKQCNLPFAVCDKALAKDTRNVIASSLKSIGVFEMYGIWDKSNPLKAIPTRFEQQEGILSNTFEQKSKTLDNYQNSQSELSNSLDYKQSPSKDILDNSIMQLDMPMLNSSGDLGLTPSDKQVLSMARKYLALREGEWWTFVKNASIEAEVVPIEADFALMDSRLEYSFDAAQAVQMEQMELYQEDQSIKKNTENQFIGQILTKKSQQIKSEWLKKYGKSKSGSPFPKKKV